jgi:hypothetical protein
VSNVKIKTSDQIFSKCIRERNGWRCERCGAQHQEGSMGLHASHYHGRGKWGVRFDPDNVSAHCYGCHSYFGSNPIEHTAWVSAKLGEPLFSILNERAQDGSLGRFAKRGEKDIRAHYRAELNRLQALRAAGESGWIAVDNWC